MKSLIFISVCVALIATVTGCSIFGGDATIEIESSEDAASLAKPTNTPEFPTETPVPDTPTPTPTTDIAEPTPLAVLGLLTPTPIPTLTATPVPTVTNTSVAEATARKAARDDIRRCQNWALQNMPGFAYHKFMELDPYQMDDLDRSLWRDNLNSFGSRYGSTRSGGIQDRLGPGGDFCRDYYSEAISEANSTKRNEQFKIECYSSLVQGEQEFRQWAYQEAVLAQDISYRYVPRETINQYTRLLNWLDIPANNLILMESPPHAILREEGIGFHRYDVPQIMDDERIVDVEVDKSDWKKVIEWWGLGHAFLKVEDKCGLYYPQLFYGRWMPVDSRDYEPPDEPLPQRALDRNRNLFVLEQKNE